MTWKKYTLIALIAAFLILFAVGLSVSLDSISAGKGTASNVLAQNGGSMDTAEYQLYIHESIETYRLLGITLLAGGIAGSIVFVRIFLDKG